MSNIMIDIETLGKTAGCQVIQVAAVRFHLDNQMTIEDEIILNFDRFDPDVSEMTVDEVTRQWWHDQPQRVKDTWHTPGQILMQDGLEMLNSFIKSNSKVWAKPATFDLPILRACYDKVQLKTSWHYRQEMCARTLYMLMPKPAQDEINQIVHLSLDPGWIEHYALDDAKEQAMSVQLCHRWMREHTW